jgi:hypothetical protein
MKSRLNSRNVTVKIYKTIILQVVLYGCETWFLTLSEEHRVRMFENRVIIIIIIIIIIIMSVVPLGT